MEILYTSVFLGLEKSTPKDALTNHSSSIACNDPIASPHPPPINEKSLFLGILKSKWALLLVAALIILIIGNGMGKANAKVPLNDKKVDYDQLVLKIQEKEKELISCD